MIPKVVILDRENTLNVASSDPASPFYYILQPEHLILKPGVVEAISIIRAHKVPVILATKQRCIGKGLTTRWEVDSINRLLEEMLGLQFAHILVEEKAETKAALYREIVKMYPMANSRQIVLFDDSLDERGEAWSQGLTATNGVDLYKAVCNVFSVHP